MKIYLINPDYMLYANAPLGLAYIAAYVRKKFPDVKVRILDQIPSKKMLDILCKEKPEIVGITSVSENWFRVKKLAEEIKKVSKKSRLVIGGVHVTTFPKCFEKSAFDYGILGEGEIPFGKLEECIKNNQENALTNTKGIIFRQGAKIIDTGISEQIKDLDTLPSPALELLNMKYYTLPNLSSGLRKSFIILTSRGCPYKCTFCSSSCFWERKIRFFSAERVINEIETLYKKYGIDVIEIADDLFSINEERLKKIVAGLKKKKMIGKVKFRCTARANNFNENVAKLLQEMGVYFIAFGFESGSEKELRYLKGESVNVGLNKKSIEICNRYGMTAYGFFMAGSPHENLKDLEETYDFIKNNCVKNFSLYQTIAYPGTEVWGYALKNKIINEDFYEKDTGEFIDADTKPLLSKDISKEDFKQIFLKIKQLQVKNSRMTILKNMHLKNLPGLFRIIFFKKAWNLKKRFIERIK